MPLLIDGYNLLHVTGIVGRGPLAGSLQGSRLALLNFLAESIAPSDLPHTVIVFDAQEAPPGLPRMVRHRGMTVRFAAKEEEADDLIEELIALASAPRRLVVVSSDHRIQRAAHRRKATAVDSDLWYAELIQSRRQREQTSHDPERPAVPLLEEDVDYWLRQFGGEAAFADLLKQDAEPSTPSRPQKTRPRPSRRPSKEPPNDKPTPETFTDLDNPFPPGYGEDLLRGP